MPQMAAVSEYHAPSSLTDCLDLLASADGDVVILAGGQSVMPLLKQRHLKPDVLLDLGKVELLRQRSAPVEPGGALELGAMVPFVEIRNDPVIARRWSALVDAAANIGDRQIQNRGTLGGNIVVGSVGTDLKQVVMCLDAELSICGPEGSRTASALQAFGDARHALLAPGELLQSVRFPALGPGSGSAYVKYGITANGRPVIGVAAVLTVDDSGTCTAARLLVGGILPTPHEADEVREILVGSRVDADAIRRAADAAAAAVSPQDDARASAAYRKQLTRVYGRQALERALQRAQEDRG